MTYIHIHITGQCGNQYFQYWVAKWLSHQLNRPLSVYMCEGSYINPSIYPNIDLSNIQYIPIEYKVEPDNGIYCYKDSDDPSLINIYDIIDKHKTTTIPLHLRFNVEDYSLIRAQDTFVKELYSRNMQLPLKCNKSIVIHIRLGDNIGYYQHIHNNFKKFCIDIIQLYNLPILIVTEDTNSYYVLDIINDVSKYNKCINVISGNKNDWQYHFDTISSASVIIMSHSTFSWWASYLNSFNPDVYVGLSNNANTFCIERNYQLFLKDSPDKWKLYNLDNNDWY